MLRLRTYVALFLLSVVLLDGCRGDLDAVSIEADENGGSSPNENNIDCKENEVYSQCSANPSCEKTCDNIDRWEGLPCSREKVCAHGCVCKKGYVRNKYQGECVWENSCPRVKH